MADTARAAESEMGGRESCRGGGGDSGDGSGIFGAGLTNSQKMPEIDPKNTFDLSHK